MSVELIKAAESLLADAIVEGMLRERERIIKLFEEQDHAAWLGMNEAAITLIKGENK